jgi:hypothetical protein
MLLLLLLSVGVTLLCYLAIVRRSNVIAKLSCHWLPILKLIDSNSEMLSSEGFGGRRKNGIAIFGITIDQGSVVHHGTILVGTNMSDGTTTGGRQIRAQLPAL